MLRLLCLLLILPFTSSDSCSDVSHDCRLIAVKCLSPNRIEQKLMEVACPRTCGYCIDSQSFTTTTVSPDRTTDRSRCIDEADDCADRSNFCHRKFYKRMMSLQCAKTCKFCDSDEEYEEEETLESRETHLANLKSKVGEESVKKLEKVKNKFEGKSRKITRPTEKVDQEECVDRSSECERNQKLCTHKAYVSLFRKICAKTCEYCELLDAEAEEDGEGGSEELFE